MDFTMIYLQAINIHRCLALHDNEHRRLGPGYRRHSMPKIINDLSSSVKQIKNYLIIGKLATVLSMSTKSVRGAVGPDLCTANNSQSFISHPLLVKLCCKSV